MVFKLKLKKGIQEFPLWRSGNESNQYPWGFRFNPWPHLVGQGSSTAVSYGVDLRCSSDPMLLWLWLWWQLCCDSTPSLGTSICHRCASPTKKGKKKKKKQKKWIQFQLVVEVLRWETWSSVSAVLSLRGQSITVEKWGQYLIKIKKKKKS